MRSHHSGPTVCPRKSPEMANLKNEKIGIVGSGLIGKSWAMIFASEGFNVKLYDVDKNQVAKAIEVIYHFFYKHSCKDLHK